MIEVADALNTFAQNGQQETVQPEEQIFVLTSSQLQAIIDKTTEPLYREIALDRQRIAKLERKEPQPMQRDRADILRALLATNGGKMLAKDARQKMHLSKSRFSELLSSMKGDIETKQYHLNRSAKVLLLK